METPIADAATLVQLYSQTVHSSPGLSSRLVVSEDLWFSCILNGANLDFFDLAANPPEDGLCSLKFLCSERLHSPATEAQISPYDPSMLAVGTSAGTLAFLRLRRSAFGGPTSPSSVLTASTPLSAMPRAGALLVHKTLEKTLAAPSAEADAPRAVDAIRFHPRQRGLCAVACGGRVHLVQHDLGLLAATECCAGPSSHVCSLAWCGPLLACGEADGTVRIWRLAVELVDPRTPSVPLAVESECIGALPPPTNAPVAAVTTMRWLALDVADGADAADGAARRAKTRADAPLGVLCCANRAPSPQLRAWSISKAGEVFLQASLPIAPLRGATSLVLSETLAPRPLASAAHPSEATAGIGPSAEEGEGSHGEASCGAPPSPTRPYGTKTLQRQPSMTQPMARSFSPTAEPRWLLCGAAGSPSVFALPWGRASEHADAEATFPTAVELLNAPSVPLEPTPQDGVRGLHRISSDACRTHLAEALGLASERSYFAGPEAAAGFEIVLVLSDKALHVVLHAARAATAGPDAFSASPSVYSPYSQSPSPQKQHLVDVADEDDDLTPPPPPPPPPPLPAHHVPLISHLLPATRKCQRDPSSAPPQASAAAGDKFVALKPDSSALQARIHELEQRALDAEERLAELQTSFGIFAAQSRQQTNALLNALDQMVAQREQAELQAGSR